jgi:hypothetical protein
MSADGVRAVATDEIQRKDNGALVDVFRPGFNLDLLQSVPSLMARHWLIRREVCSTPVVIRLTSARRWNLTCYCASSSRAASTAWPTSTSRC